MKVSNIIESCDSAIKLCRDLYSHVHGKNINKEFVEKILDELAHHFAVIDPLVEQYGQRYVPFGPNNVETDKFRATLAINDMGGSGIIRDCIAELMIIKEKILIKYKNDLNAIIEGG